MCRIKKVMFSLFFACIVALPAGLYAQDNTQGKGSDTLGTSSTDQNTETNTSSDQSTDNSMGNTSTDQQGFSSDARSSFSTDQIDQAFAGLNEKPDDNVKSQLEGIAETQARDFQTKLGLDDDSFNEIKDAINNYLDEGWKARVELAKEAGDPESYNDKSADLAYLRVDLAADIKDELGETGETQWNSHAVDFWTSLDKADFEVKAREAGISTGTASETPGMMDQNQNQLNMENEQQNMNESQQNTEQSPINTDESQGSTDQKTTDEDQNTAGQDKNTEEEQISPDQSQ